MATNVKETFIRRNITLPTSAVDRLKNIREKTEAVSDSEVIRQALKYYSDLVSSTPPGHSRPPFSNSEFNEQEDK